MQKKVVVIVPFYQDTLSDYELIALQQCAKILSAYPIIAIKPASLILPAETEQISFNTIISFDDQYFDGITGYNHLILSTKFYQTFLNYEYLLIHQLDAFVFKDELSYWCNQDLDYIGAPWIRKKNDETLFKKIQLNIQSALYTYLNINKKGVPSPKQFINKVGNGGLSLRRVKKFYEITISMQASINFYLSKKVHQYNEDAFWSIEVNRKNKILNIPSYKVALKFAFEDFPERAYLLNDKKLPFGCHGWDSYTNFWQPIFKKYHYNI